MTELLPVNVPSYATLKRGPGSIHSKRGHVSGAPTTSAGRANGLTERLWLRQAKLELDCPTQHLAQHDMHLLDPRGRLGRHDQ